MQRWFLVALLALSSSMVAVSLAQHRSHRHHGKKRPSSRPGNGPGASGHSGHPQRTPQQIARDRAHAEQLHHVLLVKALAERTTHPRAAAEKVLTLARQHTSAESARVFTLLHAASKQMQALEKLDEAIRSKDVARWRQVEAQELHGTVGKQASELRLAILGIEVLRRAPDDWHRGHRPDVQAIRAALAGIAGIAELRERADHLGQDTSLRALLAGHPHEARQLLNPQGDPAHAAHLLRDLKAMLTGEGEVVSDSGRQAWQHQAPLPGVPRGPPPGMNLLLPEAEARSYRPAVREPATAGLPLLDDTQTRLDARSTALHPLVEGQLHAAQEQVLTTLQRSEQTLRQRITDGWLQRHRLRHLKYPACVSRLLAWELRRQVASPRPASRPGNEAQDAIAEHLDDLVCLIVVDLAQLDTRVNAHTSSSDWDALVDELFADGADRDGQEQDVLAYRLQKVVQMYRDTTARLAQTRLGTRLAATPRRCQRLLSLVLLAEGKGIDEIEKAIDDLGCAPSDDPKNP